MPLDARFPLAEAIEATLDGAANAISGGTSCDLLEQVTPVTSQLLRFWFERDYCEMRPFNFHEGQRRAILNIIYAHEVIAPDRLADLYERLAPDELLRPGLLEQLSRSDQQHPKYAAKMATGTGKTWVLNALLIWQRLNNLENPPDRRFSSNFLVVAPGLIVYDRLLDSFLGKERGGTRRFEASDFYHYRDLLVPESHRDSLFGFVEACTVTKEEIGKTITASGGLIAITNWHFLSGDEESASTSEPPMNDSQTAKMVENILPLTPSTSMGHDLNVLDRQFLRGGALEYLKDLADLVVFNDEAHHIHDLKKEGQVTEVEWQKSLSDISATKGNRFVQIDFSATPYNDVGSPKRRTRVYFPHIVINFDLSVAIGAGLVKALALDKRKEVASLPLDFRTERDDLGLIVGLSEGQRTMLRAGLTKLKILEDKFVETNPRKHPKLLVICEDTTASKRVADFMTENGCVEQDILIVDSGRKQELTAREWSVLRERLFDVDARKQPKVIISVLMLREGFDVNNICVIVPLRASEAPILLEQTIGRGLRLMWRGDSEIDELKRDTRERFRKGLEPTNYFDVLFVVEHPAFSRFYDDLVRHGLAGDVTERSDKTSPSGDLELIHLRDDFAEFDFKIPFILSNSLAGSDEPSIDPLSLTVGKYPFELVRRAVGKGDRFTSEDAQTHTQYGDYRVSGGVMTATGYNDYLSRMSNRIASALRTGLTRSASKYSDAARYPLMQGYLPALTGWVDSYIRNRLFGHTIDPLEDENWRVLLIDDVAKEIVAVFASALVEATSNVSGDSFEVLYHKLSEIRCITVRASSCVTVKRCIYPKLPIPSRAGGLERTFIEWADTDSQVSALAKIHEYQHDFMRRPYLKADGMPGQYSPDFLVRIDREVFLVETKAQTALSDENVLRKQRAALFWVDGINSLPDNLRQDHRWYYVLLGEDAVYEWRSKNARVSDLLNFARLRRPDAPVEQRFV